ncbi:hypothetical protein EDB19DRAFT_1763196 [Suillus lakei]|nr:hypothetical protein EDB19DRAFT_1791242 [Suillus lakei]KAG1723290.1 hypothetical protein EDB19DRAFT_1764067 [Suillus lakei]KAG1723442.1 hypothetical protein EDB19DRAFT_1763196 [Suillus lakei]
MGLASSHLNAGGGLSSFFRIQDMSSAAMFPGTLLLPIGCLIASWSAQADILIGYRWFHSVSIVLLLTLRQGIALVGAGVFKKISMYSRIIISQGFHLR